VLRSVVSVTVELDNSIFGTLSDSVLIGSRSIFESTCPHSLILQSSYVIPITSSTGLLSPVFWF
jgi:hypothetical protein